MTRTRTRPARGFTLVELIIATAISGILLVVALPGLTRFVDQQRVAATLHELRTDLSLARTTAVMRRVQVVVCPRQPGLVQCGNQADWTHGWLVFLDRDLDRRPNDPADILRLRDPPGTSPALVAMASNRPYVRYQNDGRAAHANQTLQACARGRLMGTLTINNVGRVRSSRPPSSEPCPFTLAAMP